MSTPILQIGNWCAIHHGCEQMHASERKLYVPFIISVSTPMLQRGNFMCHTSWVWADACFREETLCVIHHQCEHTHASERKLYVPYIMGVSRCMLQRGNFMCHSSSMWAHPCFREKTLCAIHHQCEHTHASERKHFVPYSMGVSRCMLQGENFMCHTSSVWAHP